MSYTLTLDMPQKAVRFVERQATCHGTDFSALFMAFLHEHFGFGEETDGEETTHLVSEEVGTLTKQLSGIVCLPDGVSDKELIATAMLEKYHSLS